MLKERGVSYDECSCAKAKIRRTQSNIRKKAKEAFESDKSNNANLLALLALPSENDVANMVDAASCNCSQCTLANQDDFKSQKNGLEEVYESFNKLHGTNYQCILFPKFHHELNPIERCWNTMKRFTQ